MTGTVIFTLGLFFGALLQWWFDRTFYGRVDAAEQCILDLLAASPGPMYGLDMVEQSGGLLARGTVYVLLHRLQERGLVMCAEQARDGRRRYTLVASR